MKKTPAMAAGKADHQWSLEEVVELIDVHFKMKEEAMFEAAFAERVSEPRTNPKTYTPVAPKLPWYLDPESGGKPDS